MKTHNLSAESNQAAVGIRDNDNSTDATVFDFTELEEADFPRDADHGTEAEQAKRLAAAAN